MTMCPCAGALKRAFDCVENAVFGQLKSDIIAGCDALAQSPKWMSAYRCRTCDTHWVEAFATSGHMEIDHLYPLPSAGVADPARWLEEHGESLPLRHSY